MAFDIRSKQELPNITKSIVDTYTECSRTSHLAHEPLPSREAIVEILNDLMDVLYPGYWRRQNLNLSNVTYYVGDLLDRLLDRLGLQIGRALRHELDCDVEDADPMTEEEIRVASTEKSLELLKRIPEIRRKLDEDVRAAYEGDPAAKSYHEIVCCYPGVEAVTIYRVAHELVKLGVPLLPRMMTEFAHVKTGIDIHPGAEIGEGFFIDHGTGVVVGETCELGKNVKLYQGVTLGALSFPRDAKGNIIKGTKRHPTLEEDVVVYANATILGGETVLGKGAVIGAGVWLTHSVDPQTVVTMEKPSLRIKGPNTRDVIPPYQI